MNETAPAFAVVGRTNKGKSSIVSTFIEDESVAVDSRPDASVYSEIGITQGTQTFTP